MINLGDVQVRTAWGRSHTGLACTAPPGILSPEPFWVRRPPGRWGAGGWKGRSSSHISLLSCCSPGGRPVLSLLYHPPEHPPAALDRYVRSALCQRALVSQEPTPLRSEQRKLLWRFLVYLGVILSQRCGWVPAYPHSPSLYLHLPFPTSSLQALRSSIGSEDHSLQRLTDRLPPEWKARSLLKRYSLAISIT